MDSRRCADCRELISAFIDGEVSPRERFELRTHLATCSECRAVLESYRSIGDRIRSLPPVHSPEHLTDTIFSQTIDAGPGRLFLITSRVGYSMAAVAAVALIFVIAGYLIIGGYERAIQPVVASSAPTVDQQADPWPVQRPVEIEFNKSMDRESVESALAIEPPGELDRLVKRWDGNTLIIGGNPPLRPDTTYHIKISSDARDSWGNRLDPPFSLRFTTASSVPAFQTPTPSIETVVPPTETPSSATTATMPAADVSTPTSDSVVVTAPTQSNRSAEETATEPAATATSDSPGTGGSQTAATITPTVAGDDTANEPAPTATATPTFTPTSTPTSTPTTVAEPTATPTSTSTPVAPTSTPTSMPTTTPTHTPAPTATPETIAVTGSIGNLYWGDESVRSRIGQPRAASHTTPAQLQGFQRGSMFLRSDISVIYVLSANGLWSSFPDTATSYPEAEYDPDMGLWKPGGALGSLWRSNLGIAEDLGYATSESATYFISTVQEFQHGVILVGTNSIYVIYYDAESTWEFYPSVP